MTVRRTCLLHVVAILFAVFLACSVPVAATDYSLPESTVLPDQKLLYRISRNLDRVSSWYTWGDVAAVKRHLRLADKYLVEAKLLFKKRNFLYAIDALERSNLEFERIPRSIEHAILSGKDIISLRTDVQDAAKAHVAVLGVLSEQVPEVLVLTPADEESEQFEIREQLFISAGIRKSASSLISD